MGSANSRIINNTGNSIVAMSFNNADKAYTYYNGIATIQPGQETWMYAAADAWGIQLAIGYEVVGSKLLWRMWFCPNGSTLTLDYMNGSDMSASGCEHKGTGSTDLDNDTLAGIMDVGSLVIDAAGAAAGAATGGGGRVRMLESDASGVTKAQFLRGIAVDNALN